MGYALLDLNDRLSIVNGLSIEFGIELQSMRLTIEFLHVGCWIPVLHFCSHGSSVCSYLVLSQQFI